MRGTKRILAIESSGRHASAALLCGNADDLELVGQSSLSSEERTAQVLAPTIQQLLNAADWPPKTIELVAVTIGPGSFTGLRIGITTAKAFAYAVAADVIGVNTLESMALQATPSASSLWTILDAQRQELFAAKFFVTEHHDICVERGTCIISQDHWLAGLQSGDRVIGPALKRLASRLPSGIDALPEQSWHPMATSVGQLAWKYYQAGHRDSIWKLSPNYYRPSAAEEKRTL